MKASEPQEDGSSGMIDAKIRGLGDWRARCSHVSAP